MLAKQKLVILTTLDLKLTGAKLMAIRFMLIAKLMVNTRLYFQITYRIKISGIRKEVTAQRLKKIRAN